MKQVREEGFQRDTGESFIEVLCREVELVIANEKQVLYVIVEKLEDERGGAALAEKPSQQRVELSGVEILRFQQDIDIWNLKSDHLSS